HWPTQGREDISLALAGALLRAGWAEEKVKSFVAATTQAAHDEESVKRVRAVDDTAARIARNEAITGWPTLGEILGEHVVDRLQQFLGIAAPDLAGNDSGLLLAGGLKPKPSQAQQISELAKDAELFHDAEA